MLLDQQGSILIIFYWEIKFKKNYLHPFVGKVYPMFHLLQYLRCEADIYELQHNSVELNMQDLEKIAYLIIIIYI